MTDERVILEKIETRKAQIARISYIGPSVTMAIGIAAIILGLILSVIITIVGALLLIGGYLWYSSKERESLRLSDEIRELKAGLPGE